ncbi:MAG: hypothetical protein LBS12_01905 [Prevotellaceae bacterium]|nr:hypothetical protein [Prevotellaceae bacterium]
MKKILFLSILALSLTPAFGQRVVEIRQISTTYGATPTVTFEVYWNTAPVGAKHLDSVWVFVDFQRINAGNVLDSWTPATLTTPVASVSAGTPSYPFQPAARGFYLRGNATGAFTAEVTVALQNLDDAKFNWCAYATDYPPNATLGTAHYDLHGTPPFVVNGSTLTAGVRTFSGDCITALTDATGCPGILPAPPATPVLTASPDSICTGDTTTLTATAADAAFYSFDDGATWITNNSATFSPTTTTEYTIYIKNAAGCTATGAPATVTLVPPPVPVFISPPATYCADSTFDLTASAGSGSSYCFKQTYAGASHNPYLSGNDTDAGVDCDFPTVEYCSPSGDSTFSVRMPESGSVTICLRAWNAFGCPADTCVTIGATPAPAFALISPQGTNVQTIPLGQPLTTVTYGATDATTVTVEGLPAGLSYTWNAPNVEITGTAAASATVGAHSYTVTAAGNCGTTTTQGIITIAGELFSMVTRTVSDTSDSLHSYIHFTGTMYIDWGDGTSTYTTGNGWKNHFYTDGLPAHTVTAQARTVTSLQCGKEKLTALDVTQCPSLTTLVCSDNQLTALDVTQCSALTYLHCTGNQLTALDVTNNTALTNLQCYYNQLTELDVTKNTLLTILHCAVNQLTALDVSQNTAATSLTCYGNKLTSLDVTKNTALLSLNCGSNSLTALDVSKNTALTTLSCGHSQLSELDVSKNTALVQLTCNNNLLTELNVDANTELINLQCYSNPLGVLDIRYNTKLKTLYCHSNQLPALDISNNPDLIQLWCNNNQLAVLDLSQHPGLTELRCGINPLDTLDISHNRALTSLDCRSLQLTDLDVSQHTALTYLACPDNLLESVDVSNNIALTELNCYNNRLIALNVTTNTALNILRCSNNQLTATALDYLFSTLRIGDGTQTIYISNNPKSGTGAGSGTTGCNPSLAVGWTVDTTGY